MHNCPLCNCPVEKSILVVSDLVLEVATGKCYRNGFLVRLSIREIQALSFMMRNRGKTLTRTDIANGAWSDNYKGLTNKVDVYMNYLRNKIDKPDMRPLIHTVRYVGYRLGIEGEYSPCSLQPKSVTQPAKDSIAQETQK